MHHAGPSPPLDPACWKCMYTDNRQSMEEAQCSVAVMEDFCTPAPQNSTQCYP